MCVFFFFSSRRRHTRSLRDRSSDVCSSDLVVGPSDQAANFRSFPSYWSIVMPRWRRRGGDFDHDEELNRKVSPLYHVDKIRAPLLIGQGKNDPRVAIATSDAMVAALRK